MFKKLLIANRGEIALRILRACQELGIKTVAVHSTADTDSLHVKFADESVCIGPAESLRSYLNIPAIMSAAEITGADAIHPGYGFLAENASFAEICEQCTIAFVGPRPHHLTSMGNKWRAREIAAAAGVAPLPGGKPEQPGWQATLKLGREIGFPVMLKAAEGGGGKGIKIVHDEHGFEESYLLMQSEAKAAFGNADLYLERYLRAARHVEVQILADSHGNMVHCGERECSVQRRFQKMIEETPSPAVSPALRQAMGEAALKIAAAVQYCSAGTVEFLVDEDRNFYFLEMNTRIQVEHPITEMVAGIDLIAEQIRIAAGEPLRYKQDELRPRGHAIECRITAEDAETMRPSCGRIENVHLPGGHGIRVDSAIYAGFTVTPYYDSLLAKLIAYAPSRPEAIAKMRRALHEMQIQGIATTLPLHCAIFEDADFQRGVVTTNFLDRFLPPKR